MSAVVAMGVQRRVGRMAKGIAGGWNNGKKRRKEKKGKKAKVRKNKTKTKQI